MAHPAHPRPLLPGHALRQALLGPLCSACLVLGAQAASLQEPADALQRQDAAAPAAVGKTLDRALSVDTSTGQRNLDLLLEARNADEAAGAKAQRQADLPTSPPTGRPGLPQALVATPALPPAPPLGLQPPERTAASGAEARREWLGGLPTGMGAGITGQGAVTGSAGAGRELLQQRVPDLDAPERGRVVSEVVRFVRENRYWLFGALALVAAVGAGVQAYVRRTSTAPEHRAAQLVDQLDAHHGQRRTRRRSERRA